MTTHQPTATETRMLALLAEGHTHHQIASAIGTTERAVAMGLSRLYARLGAHNAANAVAIAMRAGLITSEVGS